MSKIEWTDKQKRLLDLAERATYVIPSGTVFRLKYNMRPFGTNTELDVMLRHFMRRGGL